MAFTLVAGVVITWMTAIQAVLVIASMAYQITQAKKAKKAADAAAEARKGFELPLEGEVTSLPIVYGRAMVGGTRVYHNTKNRFTYATPNSDKSFDTGHADVPAKTIDTFDADGAPTTQNIPAQSGGQLSQDLNGDKNEFLFFQQMLCQGPINAVYDVLIDRNRYIDDPDFGTGSKLGSSQARSENPNVKAAFRIDLHYDGTEDDAIMTANFGERQDAIFDGIAYASAVFKLDRDNPQFASVPQLQFLIEGKKVRTISIVDDIYMLSETRTYSNNPAWCLLDYLLDDEVGKALGVNELDYESFYKAAAVCATIVQTGVRVGGKFYQPTDGSRSVTVRNLPLYECNIVIDTNKAVRENVEALLSCMGDGRLVWSGGVYKLSLQYPLSNDDIEVAAVINDDQLVMDQEISVHWPTSSERLNSCTVRFHNENEDFKEDTASWPPKADGTYYRGIGGISYAHASGWSATIEAERFLNDFAVWHGFVEDGATATFRYAIVAREAGAYALHVNADDAMTMNIYRPDGSILQTVSHSYGSISTYTIVLAANTIYKILISAANSSGLVGIAWQIEKGNATFWSSRDQAFSDYEIITRDNYVYDAYKTEDNNIALETDLFADGITDYQHAVAKAEEMVRTSRSAFGLTFKYNIQDVYLEPGDIIRFESPTLIGLGEEVDLFIRVNETKVDENGICEVTGTRFDSTQLAWSPKDDPLGRPPPLFNFGIDAPRNLVYTPTSAGLENSAGTLSWEPVSSPKLQGYITYIWLPLNDAYLDPVSGAQIFQEIGRTTSEFFTLPALEVNHAIFGVRALANDGSVSTMTVTSEDSTTEVNSARQIYLDFTTDPVLVPMTAGVADYTNASTLAVLYEKFINVNEAASIVFSLHDPVNVSCSISNTTGTRGVLHVINVPDLTGQSAITVKATYGTKEFVKRLAIHTANAVDIPDVTPPPEPTGVVIDTSLNTVFVEHDIPVYTVGGGHLMTRVYGAHYASGDPLPVFSDATPIYSFNTPASSFPNALGQHLRVWIVWVSKAAIESNPAGGTNGYDASTGLIGGHDLTDLIIEARHIADEGITAAKFANEIQPVTFVPSASPLPTVKTTELLSWQDKIYKWDSTATPSPKYTEKVLAGDISGQLTNSQIADLAAAKVTGTIVDTQISSGAITTPKLATGAITTAKIAANAVTAGELAAYAVTAGKIDAGAVSTNELAANAVTSNKILAGEVTTGKLGVGAVIAGNIAANTIAVGDAAITNGAITNAKIGALAVDTANIATLAVTTLKISGNAVTVPSVASQSSIMYGSATSVGCIGLGVSTPGATFPYPSSVIVNFNGIMGFTSGARAWRFILYCNGSPVYDTGVSGAIQSLISFTFVVTTTSTSNYFQVDWTGADGTLELGYRTLTAIGAQR